MFRAALTTVVRAAICGAAVFTFVGCQGPDLNYVPWYRGIPGNFLAKNSLEGEVWRQQRTGVVEGWPTPPVPVVRDPIPLAGTPEASPLAPEEEELPSPPPEGPTSRRVAPEASDE
ncbi:MAG: hypothetical protein U0939_10860 [Pirellulales bacterium]